MKFSIAAIATMAVAANSSQCPKGERMVNQQYNKTNGDADCGCVPFPNPCEKNMGPKGASCIADKRCDHIKGAANGPKLPKVILECLKKTNTKWPQKDCDMVTASSALYNSRATFRLCLSGKMPEGGSAAKCKAQIVQANVMVKKLHKKHKCPTMVKQNLAQIEYKCFIDAQIRGMNRATPAARVSKKSVKKAVAKAKKIVKTAIKTKTATKTSIKKAVKKAKKIVAAAMKPAAKKVVKKAAAKKVVKKAAAKKVVKKAAAKKVAAKKAIQFMDSLNADNYDDAAYEKKARAHEKRMRSLRSQRHRSKRAYRRSKATKARALRAKNAAAIAHTVAKNHLSNARRQLALKIQALKRNRIAAAAAKKTQQQRAKDEGAQAKAVRNAKARLAKDQHASKVAYRQHRAASYQVTRSVRYESHMKARVAHMAKMEKLFNARAIKASSIYKRVNDHFRKSLRAVIRAFKALRAERQKGMEFGY